MSRNGFQISEDESPAVNAHLARMTGPESRGKTPAHYAAEFLVDRANIEFEARAQATAVFLLLEAWIPSLENLAEILPAAMEITRRAQEGKIQEVTPESVAERRDLIDLAKEYRQFLENLGDCGSPACRQETCTERRAARARADALLVRVGVA